MIQPGLVATKHLSGATFVSAKSQKGTIALIILTPIGKAAGTFLSLNYT